MGDYFRKCERKGKLDYHPAQEMGIWWVGAADHGGQSEKRLSAAGSPDCSWPDSFLKDCGRADGS